MSVSLIFIRVIRSICFKVSFCNIAKYILDIFIYIMATLKEIFIWKNVAIPSDGYYKVLKKCINDMEWKEIGKILKIKWEDVIIFFLSAQSEHISTPITKPVKAQCSTGNFHEESQKKKSCEKTAVSHLDNQIFILKRWEVLILSLLFWSVLVQVAFC